MPRNLTGCEVAYPFLLRLHLNERNPIAPLADQILEAFRDDPISIDLA